MDTPCVLDVLIVFHTRIVHLPYYRACNAITTAAAAAASVAMYVSQSNCVIYADLSRNVHKQYEQTLIRVYSENKMRY